MAGNFPFNVYNNMIVNNISTHEGGGVAIDDAPNVRFYNNTVMKNITTATAATSNGHPAPAGLSTSREQHPAAGHAAGRLADSSATRCCSTTSSGTTGRARCNGGGVSASAWRAIRTRSTTGISASRMDPVCCRPPTR